MSRERAEGTFRVREATAEDHSILQLILDGSFGIIGSRVHGISVVELVKTNRVYLAFFGERPVGCVMATLTYPMILHCLHVAPEDRSLGHAGNMLASAIEHLDLTSPAEFWIAVDPARRSSIDRCLSLGFLEVPIDFVELSAPLSGMCMMIRPAPQGSEEVVRMPTHPGAEPSGNAVLPIAAPGSVGSGAQGGA